MPIRYRIDHDLRLVITRGEGIFSDEDVFGYQQEVWSRPEVIGYSEFIDMTEVEEIALPSVDRVRLLAAVSAGMDTPTEKTKSAILAPQDIAYGLGRMFQIYRELDVRSTKEVGVFRTVEEALAFLGIDRLPGYPEPR